MKQQLEEFTAGYTIALLWSTVDKTDEGELLMLEDYEMSTAAADRCRADCRAFFIANYGELVAFTVRLEARLEEFTRWSYAGHQFALTRNRHGTGFWDNNLGELGDCLTDASRAAGEALAYLGDDELIYIQ